MSWGFLALNNNNQVLVSSDTRNLHFIGKAFLQETIKTVNSYGGIRQWRFRINCAVTPMPFFSMPTQEYYAVSSITQVSVGVWDIEIIRSGTSGNLVPEVYVFADPRAVTPRDTNYGMQVFRDDGTPSFDSRLQPLVVTGGISVNPPSNPKLASVTGLSAKYCESTSAAGDKLGSDNRNTFPVNIIGTKPIYYYPSIAQAQRQWQFYEAELECDDYGLCLITERSYQWYSRYWAFYRGGISRVGSFIFCGWITVEYGCNWDYRKSSSIIGIGIGGDSGNGGTWPYSNETLNLDPTAVIIADGARYD